MNLMENIYIMKTDL